MVCFNTRDCYLIQELVPAKITIVESGISIQCCHLYLFTFMKIIVYHVIGLTYHVIGFTFLRRGLLFGKGVYIYEKY